MSHPEHTDHGHATGPTASPFTPEELEQLHSDDRHAGGAVLVLMAGIFAIGLVLYLGVAVWVGMS